MIDNGYNECVEFDDCADCMIHYSKEKPKAPEKQKFYKSWAVWLSVAGLISVIFTALNVWEKIGIDSTTFETIVTDIGAILTAFGIINNPTEKGSFQ